MANLIISQRDTQLEKQRTGYIELSLTEFTTSDEPAIAAGSVVEISGSLYSFTVDEAITGWPFYGVGDLYIKLIPSGTDPCTAEFTATAPTWSDAKQGWYDALGADRYVAGLYKTSATEYDNKYIITQVGSFDNTIPGDNTFTGDNKINASQITGLAYGGIGTYVIAASTSWNLDTSYQPGTTVNGNTLVRHKGTGVEGAGSLNAITITNMSVDTTKEISLNLTGTWVLMTRVRRTVDVRPIGLFLRTA